MTKKYLPLSGVISSKTKRSANRAAAALRLAANALHRSDSALGAFLRRKKAQLGAPQGHHCHRPQAGQGHLFHAALWPGIRGCWRRILRDTVSAASVARGQAPGGPTGLPTGTNVRRWGPHHVPTSRRANRRVTTLVSGEQSLGRTLGMGWSGVGRLTLVSVNRRLASGQVNLVECGIGLPVIDGDDHRAGGVGYVPYLARAASLSGVKFPRCR